MLLLITPNWQFKNVAGGSAKFIIHDLVPLSIIRSTEFSWTEILSRNICSITSRPNAHATILVLISLLHTNFGDLQQISFLEFLSTDSPYCPCLPPQFSLIFILLLNKTVQIDTKKIYFCEIYGSDGSSKDLNLQQALDLALLFLKIPWPVHFLFMLF